jgi:predicted nucleotidyltransferase
MNGQDQIITNDGHSLAELSEQAIPVLLKYGIRRAGFFGSRARGDHHPDSDLDLLIECPTDRKFSLFDLVALQDEFTEVLGVYVQLAEYGSPNERFLSRALPDEVAILPAAL